MSKCCGNSARCNCRVIAGPGITVDGNGSSTSPYVISGKPPVTGCGLTGAGSSTSPLAAAVGAWPYPCDVDTQAGGVYCDSSGVLRSEPRPVYDYVQASVNELFPDNPPVPATADGDGTTVTTRSLTITNPDPCRQARVIIEQEVDVDFVLPPGGRAGYFVAQDEMYRFQNTGNSTVFDVHTQTTKVTGNRTIPPGGSITFTLDIGMGWGAGGATYNRIQSFIRAMIFVL
ncbi:hypothetical protein AB4Z54_22720 [Streptomyces sp. MCAF7]